MSGHILIAKGDVSVQARKLVDDLAAADRLGGSAPDIEVEGDRTVVVIDQHQEAIIDDFCNIGFTVHRDEDSF